MNHFDGKCRCEFRVSVYATNPLTLEHSDGWTKGIQVSAEILEGPHAGRAVWWMWDRFEPHHVGETLLVRASWDGNGRGKRTILNPKPKTKGKKRCLKSK